MVFRKKDDCVLKLERRVSATTTTTDSQKIKTVPVAEKKNSDDSATAKS